ncbi:MAG: response regulator [Caldimonas manganoxidans]|nr:response regulator [Caldimonas manganoxidans]
MSATLLIVDDNPWNLKLARDVLELAGYTVVPVPDAEQAQAWLQDHQPDLILLDLALPGLDGLSFCRRLKAEPRWQHIPVVAVTAHAMKGDDLKALEAGCVAYIAKPIDTRRLPQQVAELLHRHRTPAAPARKARVLVVEDDRIDLRLMSEALELQGHMVLSNTSAEAAAGTVLARRPDVILLDLQLPGMDGLSFVRHLKAHPHTRDIPIVAITAYDDRFRRDELLAAGCMGYWVKPVDVRALTAQLQSAAQLNAASPDADDSTAAPSSP